MIGSQTTLQTNNNKRDAQINFHLKRPHTITKINDSVNMDSTIAGSNDHYIRFMVFNATVNNISAISRERRTHVAGLSIA